jgi:hypothetical protein
MAARIVALWLGFAPVRLAGAQLSAANGPSPMAPSEAAASAGSTTTGLRARFGTEIATHLARSKDPDDRLRGLERAAALHTREALALLVRASGTGGPEAIDSRSPLDGMARSDPRALLVVVRALADWLDSEEARSTLASIVAAPVRAFSTGTETAVGGDPSADDARGAARVLLARQEAAIALAESGTLVAFDALIAVALTAGPGQEPALDALAIHYPAAPLVGTAVPTTPALIALAAEAGDLRSLDAIEGATNADESAQRAAALMALGAAGDRRVLAKARAALRDRDAGVRLAAANALVRLGAPDASLAVEGLVGDDATALEALRLAQQVQGEGVTKAAAARAAAMANGEVRTAAVVALGRQMSGLAVAALSALLVDPSIQGDVACAMARSPSPAAMAAIEHMAKGATPMQRLAARAYFVRRFVRAETSAALDALLERLATSNDERDRTVGVEALVALGDRNVAAALEDQDARVRRAAALGALGKWSATSRMVLLARIAVEPDEATRQLLGLGLTDGDPDGVIPTVDLLERTRRGGPDAPLAALSLAERAGDRDLAEVDTMLMGNDPALREHVARGLGASAARDAVGRLARAYLQEGDVHVRRAIVAALSARAGEDTSAPARGDALRLAARLDPDRIVRDTASRALAGASARGHSIVHEVAWFRLTPAGGAALPPYMEGTLVQSERVALPIAFDDDGYALVPGVAPGEVEVRLAPRLPPYEAPPP